MCQTRRAVRAGKPHIRRSLARGILSVLFRRSGKRQVLPPPTQARIADVGANRCEVLH